MVKVEYAGSSNICKLVLNDSYLLFRSSILYNSCTHLAKLLLFHGIIQLRHWRAEERSSYSTAGSTLTLCSTSKQSYFLYSCHFKQNLTKPIPPEK